MVELLRRDSLFKWTIDIIENEKTRINALMAPVGPSKILIVGGVESNLLHSSIGLVYDTERNGIVRRY